TGSWAARAVANINKAIRCTNRSSPTIRHLVVRKVPGLLLLLHVPAVDFYDGLLLERLIARRDLARLTGKQREVVIFPEDRQHLLAVRLPLHFEVHGESQ